MVWMMFGVIGIPIKKALNRRHRVRPADGDAGADRLADPGAAGIWTRQVRRSHRHGDADGLDQIAIWLMSDATEYSAFPRHRALRRPRRRFLFSRHARCRALVSAAAAGLCDGYDGAGNSGAAVNKFVAPALVVAFGDDGARFTPGS